MVAGLVTAAHAAQRACSLHAGPSCAMGLLTSGAPTPEPMCTHAHAHVPARPLLSSDHHPRSGSAAPAQAAAGRASQKAVPCGGLAQIASGQRAPDFIPCDAAGRTLFLAVDGTLHECGSGMLADLTHKQNKSIFVCKMVIARSTTQAGNTRWSTNLVLSRRVESTHFFESTHIRKLSCIASCPVDAGAGVFRWSLRISTRKTTACFLRATSPASLQAALP